MHARWQTTSRDVKEQHKYSLGIVAKPCCCHPIHYLIACNHHLLVHTCLLHFLSSCLQLSVYCHWLVRIFTQIYNPPFLLWFLHLAGLSVPSVPEAPVPPVEQNQVISDSLHRRPSLLGHSQVRIVLQWRQYGKETSRFLHVSCDLIWKRAYINGMLHVPFSPLSYIALQRLTK